MLTWARRHGVSAQALAELADVLAAYDHTPEDDGVHGSESRQTALIRLDAAQHGVWLTRNNVGALRDKAGRFVRFGLANESKAQNAIVKSGDLIGFKRRVIVPSDVGSTIAQFASVEAKKEGWQFNPNDAHEAAQAAWRDFINVNGGFAAFANGPGCFSQTVKLLPLPR